MRIAGRQKGSKVKSYTHVVVQPNAPKSRYTFSYHSSESGAKAAAKKYEPLVGNPLRVVKQSGKSANTDMMEEMTTTADAGIPQDTKTMGPKLKTTTVHDKRRKKAQLPILLKRFRKYIEDNG